MNYEQIRDLILAYSNREDTDVVNNIDNFIVMAESRINRELRVQKMSCNASIDILDNTEYYGLPDDFAGSRLVTVHEQGSDSRTTLEYVTPEQFNANKSASVESGYYTIMADQIRISITSAGQLLEITYYQRIPNLNDSDKINWLATYAPDLYVNGAMVELNAFVKDPEAAALWDARFNDVINSLTLEDSKDRWSGGTLEIRYG